MASKKTTRLAATRPLQLRWLAHARSGDKG